MEATLALLGAEAAALVDCIEDETSEGRPAPFHVEALLTDVVPSLLSISGQFLLWLIATTLARSLLLMFGLIRVPVPSGQSVRRR